MPRVSLLFALQIASLLGLSLTSFKLLRAGLYRRYQFFFLFLLFRVPYGATTMSMAHNTSTYFYLWLSGHVVYWVFYVFVVRELCGLILEKYTGLKTLGRWFMYGSVVVALIASVASVLPGINPSIAARSNKGVLGYVLSIDKGVTISLGVFLAVLLALLSRYPVRLPRNVVVHSFLYPLFFFSNALTILWVSMFGVETFRIADLISTAVTAGCGFAWYLLLSKKGEEVTTNVLRVDKEKEERLLSQLNYLNQTLLKSGKS